MAFFDLSVFASAGPNIASETSPDEDRLFKSNVAETHSDFILQFFITSLDFNSRLCVCVCSCMCACALVCVCVCVCECVCVYVCVCVSSCLFVSHITVIKEV